MAEPPARVSRLNERSLVFLIGAVQFVNILDFLMVAPLGLDFAVPLGFDESRIGLVTGSYTAAAALAGFLGSFFLDRFERRAALRVALVGLVAGTAACGFARGLGTLMLARVVAGTFGGPATSLAFAIIADVIPPERRGRAMGAVMGALSAAQVLGVPAGLWMARAGGWRLPFFAVAGLGLAIVLLATVLLPPLRLHLVARGREPMPSLTELVARPVVRLSYAMTATVMVAGFLIVPNLPGYVKWNLGVPRERLDGLYLVAGIASFISMRAVGALVDRFGSFRVGTWASLFWAPLLYFGFVDYPRGLPVVVLFMCFSLAMSARNVAYNTLTSKVPRPRERARFLSIQSSVQHAASSLGAIGSSWLLFVRPDRTLDGMGRIAWLSIALALALPFLLRAVESRVVLDTGK